MLNAGWKMPRRGESNAKVSCRPFRKFTHEDSIPKRRCKILPTDSDFDVFGIDQGGGRVEAAYSVACVPERKGFQCKTTIQCNDKCPVGVLVARIDVLALRSHNDRRLHR